MEDIGIVIQNNRMDLWLWGSLICSLLCQAGNQQQKGNILLEKL
jgi:hypothetical protein